MGHGEEEVARFAGWLNHSIASSYQGVSKTGEEITLHDFRHDDAGGRHRKKPSPLPVSERLESASISITGDR